MDSNLKGEEKKKITHITISYHYLEKAKKFEKMNQNPNKAY